MKRGWKISITTAPEAEEPVAELLRNAFGREPAAYTDLARGSTTVTAYFTAKPEWSKPMRARLHAGLRRIERCGLASRPGRISLAPLRRENWAEAWKRHFQPLAFGHALLVKPSWSRRRARDGQAVVLLDPGLSFGTGQHPTTHFCLAQLVAGRRCGPSQPFCDLGTGSGILALAAARLGYRPVTAIDLDPAALKIARANARRNRLAARIQFRQRDLRRLPRNQKEKYSFICANLASDLLLNECECVVSLLAPGGQLVLAGLLAAEFPRVLKAYRRAGLRLVVSRRQGEWRSGRLASGPAAGKKPG
jgi:ribosomal protein L11 methyltransferase